MRETTMRRLPIRTPIVNAERRADGSILLEQAYPPAPSPRSIPHLFEDRAGAFPERVFVGRREAMPNGGWGDWRELTFGNARDQARSAAQWLLDRGITADASIMVLSGPSPEHAVMALAAQYAGVPVAALATAYSLLAEDFTKLRHAFQLCRPCVLFVEDDGFARALDALPLEGVEIVSIAPVRGRACTPYADVVATRATAVVDQALDGIGPDTVARFVFTSGSTGAPKAVIHTQRSLCAQIAARNALLDDLAAEDGAVRMSWMPWNHIGGIIQLQYAIQDAGPYYIDEGRPMPGQFGETLRNLREHVPREFVSVPILYGQLVEALEKDPELSQRFFETVAYFSYGSAALSTDIFERVQALAVKAIGARVPFCTKFGTTEVQAVTHSARPLDRPGEIGVPYPGARIKLAPYGDKLELRVKGDLVSPGYLGGPENNEGVFDDEGYARTGDAAIFVDPDDMTQGLLFDGRVSENFKLATGTWVSVGSVRVALIEALAPLIQDAVIAGHDRDFVAALAWPRRDVAARIAELPPETALADLVAHPAVRAYVAERLSRLNTRAHGSSMRVERLILLIDPPTGHEQAEKGYINQRGTLQRRSDVVSALYAEPERHDVIRAQTSAVPA
jgi:feruloyl-CoA synthase